MKFAITLIAVLVLSQVGLAQVSSAMTLQEFLKKTTTQNSYIQSQNLEQEASRLRASEGTLLTSLNFFTSGNYTSNKKESQNPTFEGTARIGSQVQAGLEQQSSFGINHKLYYALDNQKLEGVDPTFFPNPAVSFSSFNYEFTLPVWRNGFGRSTRDQVGVISEQNKSESLAAQFKIKQERASAISVYWRLKSAQELFTLSKELLASNTNFLKWTKNRFQDRLSENIDLKQAEAAVALREYELDQAQTELIEAQQAFNEMLEVPVDSVVPELEPLPDVASWKPRSETARDLSREDIESLEALLDVQKAQARMASESSKPQLDFTGHLATNGLDRSASGSFDKSLTTNNPYYAVGLKLSIPLDRGSVGDVQKSAKIKASSTETQLARKKFEVKSELEKLERNFSQAIKMYTAAQAVEKAQFAKYQMENTRRRSGRTTTFQLLSFQQEYQAAKQARIRAVNIILQINAQFTLFTSGSSL